MNSSRRAIVYGALLTGLFAAFITMARAWPDTPDGLFHLQRVRALAEALKAGVFYPRWFPDFAFGHGYPVFQYYAPGSYYPPALLHLLGVDVIAATQVATAAVFSLSGAAMLLLLRRWTSWVPALLGAAVYLFFPYRLYDFFVRGALPEFAAFVWLPLLAYGACELGAAGTSGHAERAWRSPRWVAAFLTVAAATAGMVLTHNLTALMATLAAAVAWLISLVLGPARQRELTGALSFGAAWLIGALLSAPYAIPALLESAWTEIGAAAHSVGYVDHFATWRTLGTWDFLYAYPAASAPGVPVPWYVFGLLAIAPLVFFRNEDLRPPLGLAWIGGIVSLWLMTSSSDAVWRAALPVMSKLQFPWRWQILMAFSAALLAGLAAEAAARALRRESRRRTLSWAAALIGLYVVVYATARLPQSHLPAAEEAVTAEQMWAFDAEHGQVGATWTSEFLPRWVTAPKWALGREPDDGEAILRQEPVRAQVEVSAQGYLRSAYRIRAASPMTLTLPSFYFPAWDVRLDGDVATAFPNTSLGLLAVALPAGEHRLAVTWGPTPFAWLGRIAWLVAWLGILWLLWGQRRTWPRVALAAWAGVGCLFLAAAGGWTEQSEKPNVIAADFGAVQLIGASVEIARVGEVAEVRLTWAVVDEPESLTAFVHVTDAGGQVIAQNDAPLGGLYLPAARWQPGMIVQHSHLIELPGDLAPGEYRVLAGVYRPGRADAPLVAAGQDSARVEVGVLKVRP